MELEIDPASPLKMLSKKSKITIKDESIASRDSRMVSDQVDTILIQLEEKRVIRMESIMKAEELLKDFKPLRRTGEINFHDELSVKREKRIQ